MWIQQFIQCSPDFISRRMYETPLRSNAELSDPELGDEDSNEPSPRRSSDPAPDQDVLAKLKRERDDQDETVQREIKPSPLPPMPSGSSPIVPQPAFSLPLPFPFPHPGAAFLPPAPQYTTTQHPPTTVHHAASSGSSHSSESSSSSQSQQTWSFEEQFKQVRQTNRRYSIFSFFTGQPKYGDEFKTTRLHCDNVQSDSSDWKSGHLYLLYEISDDPKRKEFLDDLFSYMQRRGTPINRLPIMAKSVLDLYELYNLVIQRGGLVDVINKKLWQEIIKGLHLPSSITSAAFTLRTQYMKYLYPYECEKRRLSTPGELQAAIDGNRREGRRGSYGTYAEMMQRSPSQMSPLSLVTAARPQVNGTVGNHHHANNNHLPPHQALLPPTIPGASTSIPANEFEARMVEYVKLLNKELRTTSTPPNHRQTTPPSSPQESALSAFDMSRLTLWNLYHNQTSPPEPQKEPINLEKREDSAVGPPPPKRHQPEGTEEVKMTGAHIKISSRNDGRGGTDNSLVVSMDINGTMYQGVLFAQSPRNNRIQSSS